MDIAENRLGIPAEVVSFVMSVGTTVNMDLRLKLFAANYTFVLLFTFFLPFFLVIDDPQ